MEQNEIYRDQPKRDTVIDFTPVLGTWMNSNTQTKWIEKFTLAKHDEQIIMHAATSLKRHICLNGLWRMVHGS